MPFSYDGKSPRLPRKQSMGYDLQDDTDSFFKERICPTLPQERAIGSRMLGTLGAFPVSEDDFDEECRM